MNEMKISEYIIRADEYEKSGNYEAMFSTLAEGIKKYPREYELYYSLGFYYLKIGNEDCAFLCFENALYYCKEEVDIDEIKKTIEELMRCYTVNVKKTAIIIVSYNLLDIQKKCIENIRKYLMPGSYRIIVVDNASSDGVREWLSEQNDIELIANEENKGFAKACNQGAKNSSEEDILLLNNDAFLTENAMFWMKIGLYSSCEIGAVGAVSNAAGNNQQIDVEFNSFNEYMEFGVLRNIPMKNAFEERVRLSGFAMLIRAGLWDESGGMGDEFSPGYFEDDDLCMKIRKLGYRFLVCKNAFVYHIGSQSFARLNDMNSIIYRNHMNFIKKYNFDIIKWAYPNVELIEKLPFNCENEFNILVIGFGLGADCIYIREKYPKANIIGVEKHDCFLNLNTTDFVVYSDVEKMKNIINERVFMAVLINTIGAEIYLKEDLDSMSSLCREDCIVI